MVEAAVSIPDRDMSKQERTSDFFFPSNESASVARRKPPARQPTKKDDVGRPVINEPAHWRDHSDTVEV